MATDHWCLSLRPYYTRLCFTGILEFYCVFTSENGRKTPENYPIREFFSILHYPLAKNASQLRFFASLLAKNASQLRFFASLLAHKPYQSTNPMHSVIWASYIMNTYFVDSTGGGVGDWRS